MKKQRGYLEHSQEVATQAWQLPDYGDKEAVKSSALNYDPAHHDSTTRQIVNETVLTGITASNLETLRQSALDDGFKEGSKAGFAKGQQQGFDQGKTQGFAEGKKQGYQVGLAEAKQKVEADCQALVDALTKLRFPAKQIDYQLEQQLVALVAQLSEAVIKTEITLNQKVILQTLQDVVAAMPITDQPLSIYLHADDLDIIKANVSQAALAQSDWQLLVNPDFARGDIAVVSGDSSIDFSMQHRIEQVLSQFLQQNYQPPPSPDQPVAEHDVKR